jgi:hypothetical protein
MRNAICWSAVLTMCVAGTARAQYAPPPGAQPTAPATGQPTPPATGQPTAPATGQPTAPPGTETPVATTPTPSSRWTVESGNTVGPGVNVFAGAVGYPGVDLQLIHGLDISTDVRAHVGINYAFEGITQGTRFEFTAQVGIRKELLSLGGNMKLAGRFDPGILIAASPGQFGIKIPFGLELGIPLGRELIANASFEVPMFFTLGDFNAFYVPLLFGGGVEYLLQPNLALTGKVKVGPTFITNGGGTQFTLYVLVGVAYKF